MTVNSSRTSADRHSNGMTRGVVETVDDSKYMQEMGLSLFADEQQQGIERFVQYGFTAVPQPPSGGGGGSSGGGDRMAAEAIFSFMGSGRSHGIAMMVGDRRYRLYKLKPGEVALHDDQGHQMHITRGGIVTSSPNSKKVTHQVMKEDKLPQDAANGQVAQEGKPVVGKTDHDKSAITATHTQKVHSQTTPNIGSGATPSSNIASQLQGMISQVSALAGAGVGLPGLNVMGGQIASVASSLTGAGSDIAGEIATLGTSMSTAAMAAMPALASSMSSLMPSLMNAVNPGGLITQATHEHINDIMNGITHNAFSGQHSTTWNMSGITHSSAVANIFNSIAHKFNGNMLNSDQQTSTKTIFAPAFTVTSDENLKVNIAPYSMTLDRAMQLEAKTFDKYYVAIDANGKAALHTDAPKPSFGYIAQHVQKICPELVSKDEVTGFLGVDESKIGIIAMHVLHEFVTETRSEMAAMRAEIAALKKQIK